MTSRMPKTSVRPMAMSAYTTPIVTPLTTCWRKTAVTERTGASREVEVGHRPPVRHGDGVELEVELLGEIERDQRGPLRLDHPLVLAEDHVLELLEHAVGLVEVVVLPDEDVATAAIAVDGLGDEEIEELLASAPVHVHDDRVGQVQL